MKRNEWVNPTRPITNMGPTPVCPFCQHRIQPLHPCYDENNHVVQRENCTNTQCGYVSRQISGFTTMKDADTAVFK